MENLDIITEKLRKILTLAGDKAAAPGEVEAAMAKAKEIALRHNIELASIALNKDTGATKIQMDVERHNLRVRSQNQQKYHRFIYNVLRDCFDIRTIIQGPFVYMVGEKVDVLIAKELFPWLENVFYQTYWKAKKAGIVVSCAADKNGIYMGLASGIIAANAREKQKLTKEEQGCMALVLRSKEDAVNAKVEEEFPDLAKSKRRALEVSYHAHAHGQQEGKKINLKQAGAGTQKGRIQ